MMSPWNIPEVIVSRVDALCVLKDALNFYQVTL